MFKFATIARPNLVALFVNQIVYLISTLTTTSVMDPSLWVALSLSLSLIPWSLKGPPQIVGLCLPSWTFLLLVPSRDGRHASALHLHRPYKTSYWTRQHIEHTRLTNRQTKRYMEIPLKRHQSQLMWRLPWNTTGETHLLNLASLTQKAKTQFSRRNWLNI